MHVATKALVLRGVDYKESDKILTLLTQDQGKLTASARGCRKKGSPLAAGCQLLSWGELVLYDYQGRWTVKEAAPERLFQGVRDDLDKLALACYFAEVIELLAVEGEPNPQLLSLILNSLHALDKLYKPLALVKAAFELKAMCLAGYEPLLEGCAVCGAEQPEEPRFHLREGVLHCAKCRDQVGEGILHAHQQPGPPGHGAHRLRGPQASFFLPGGGGGAAAAGGFDGGLPPHPAGAGLSHVGFL